MLLAEVDVLSAIETQVARWCLNPPIDQDPVYQTPAVARGKRRPRSKVTCAPAGEFKLAEQVNTTYDTSYGDGILPRTAIGLMMPTHPSNGFGRLLARHPPPSRSVTSPNHDLAPKEHSCDAVDSLHRRRGAEPNTIG